MAWDDHSSGDLADRLGDASLGLFDIATVYLGVRLGLYRALADGEPSAATGLADATGTSPRFVREWCEQQAAAGLLDCLDPSAEPDDRRFALPPGHREALADPGGPRYAAGTVFGLVAAIAALPDLADRVRLDPEPPAVDPADAAVRAGVGEANRPLFSHLLAGWLAAVPGLDDRLAGEPPARVLDVACGAGWSSLAIATEYPLVEVDAIDLDEPAIALARRNAQAAGLDGRVRFRRGDAVDVCEAGLGGPYELVCCFEAFHDLAEPVAALAAWRRTLAPGGICLVVDVRAERAFTAPAGRLERLAYGWSVVDCLPATMAAAGETATGAVMRPATFERYAGEAGFAGVEILPIEDPGWRFYRLVR